jgi:hypothetical protein
MKALFYLLAASLTWAEAAKLAELADEPETAELAYDPELELDYDPETAAVTNTWLISNSTNVSAWTRQAVMVKPDKITIIDPSETFVDTATAAAESNTVDKLSQLSDAAKAGMDEAVAALTGVTNQVPPNAYMVTLAVPPPAAPASLMGFVVKESTDGVTDTQWVWYSHRLARKPIRRVVYKTPSGEFSQDVEWVNWNADGETIAAFGRVWSGCHKCTIKRPTAARGISAVSRLNEVFGGASGFDFGGMAVLVNGRPAVTTNLVSKVDGAKLTIENGFFKTITKEIEE